MENKIKQEKKNKVFNETMNYIFNINEKEVFMNEFNSLIEEINSQKFNNIKMPIVMNFIMTKINEIEDYEKLAKQFLKDNKENNVFRGKVLTNIDQIDKTKLFMAEFLMKVLAEDYSGISGTQLEEKNKMNEVNNSDINGLMKDFQYFGNKIKAKKEKKINSGNVKLNPSYETNLIASLNFNNNNLSQNNKIYYNLKIFYSDGSDAYPQTCIIISNTILDYKTFLHNLKRKLGIYEYAKFKVIILDQMKEKNIFTDMRQIKIKEINEIKIVPYDYVANLEENI